jgi:hypothetical protein
LNRSARAVVEVSREFSDLTPDALQYCTVQVQAAE